MKRLAVLLFFSVIAIGVYFYAKEDASERVKRTILQAADLLELSPEEQGHFRRLIASVHPKAFDHALNAVKNVGGKFDAERYFREIKLRVVELANKEGRTALSEKLKEHLNQLRFDVAER